MNSFVTLNESIRLAWIDEKLKLIPLGSRIPDAGAVEQPFKGL